MFTHWTSSLWAILGPVSWKHDKLKPGKSRVFWMNYSNFRGRHFINSHKLFKKSLDICMLWPKHESVTLVNRVYCWHQNGHGVSMWLLSGFLPHLNYDTFDTFHQVLTGRYILSPALIYMSAKASLSIRPARREFKLRIV